MFKISYNMSSNILGYIFDQRTSSNHLLKNNDFVSRQVHCVYQGTEWLSFLGPNIWDLQPLEIKQSESFDMYEAKINRYTPSECPCTLFWTYIQDSLFEDSFKIKHFKNHFYCYYQLNYFLSILIVSLSFDFIICIIIYSKISFS